MTPLLEIHSARSLPLLNVWQRMHWRKRTQFTRELATEIAYTTRRPSEPIDRCLIVIERRSTGRLPDWDGLTASAKPVLDALVVPSKANPHGLGIIADDNPDCVGMLLVLPEKRSPEQRHATWVGIYPDNKKAAEYLFDMMRIQIIKTRRR